MVQKVAVKAVGSKSVQPLHTSVQPLHTFWSIGDYQRKLAPKIIIAQTWANELD